MPIRTSSVLLPLLLALVLTGCWDGRELERRALVMVVALDRSDDGVQVSLQLARPQTLAGASGQPDGGDGEPVTVVARSGASVSRALQALQFAVDRELFFGHVRVVVVSEQIASSGLWPLLQPLVGDQLMPRNAWLFVVRGSAAQVLAARPALDRIPATYLSNFFENRLLLQRTYDVTLGGFHQRWVTPGEEPIAIWIAPVQEDQSAPALLGLAALRGDRFIGGLDWDASLGWLITQNQAPPDGFPVPCPDGDGTFSVRMVRSANRLRPVTETGRLTGLVASARVRGRIEEIDCGSFNVVPAEMGRFELAFRRAVERHLKQAFDQAQAALGSDIFGFGKAVYRFAPAAWPGDSAWAESFPHQPIRTEVSVRLDFSRSYGELPPVPMEDRGR